MAEKAIAVFCKRNRQWIVAVFIIVIGVLIRTAGFGIVPEGFNHDEAFAGYEAYSLLNYGVDSAGYRNPCYFVAWGSGMNVLESYLAIPFMKLFGCSVITFRLPQLLCSCFSLLVFYLLLKELFSSKTALLGLGLLAIAPWHIMLSRWGLESNIAPAFLLFGFYFLIKGIKNNRFWILSAILYGLCLYAYAITWIAVPLTVLLSGIYIITKQKVSLKYVFLSVFVFFVFAAPLILFLLVNYDLIPEISTRFLSIPRLLSIRDAEISFGNFISAQSYHRFFNIVVNQEDGLLWNTPGEFGLFYKISFPFILLGGVKLAMTAWKRFREKSFCYETVLLIGTACSLLTCFLVSDLNVNKANSLHFYTLILLTAGIREIFVLCGKRALIPKTVLCCYAISFFFFLSFYFGPYNEAISYPFRAGVEDAVKYVQEKGFSDICVDSDIYYSQILFFDRTPNDVYLETVEYKEYPAAFLQVEKFGKYTFGINSGDLDAHEAYIIKTEQNDFFSGQGYEIFECKNFSVAHK